ncbi:MAG: hypothetical protein HS116_28235 [Planctomycetes bacterium]|nr:hypothetical protein [Planctomycetota bacterium]
MTIAAVVEELHALRVIDMIDYQVQREGENTLIGIGIPHAVLDIKTNQTLLLTCLDAINTFDRSRTVSTTFGSFGDYPITLNLSAEGQASIFIDRPWFQPDRVQSAAIWLPISDLKAIIEKALE